MNTLNIELENCYGIKKLEKEFNFTIDDNVNAIYAKNGLMKTSLQKFLKCFKMGKKLKLKI